MNCDELVPLMEAYLDSELDARSAAEVAAHLEACADCRAEFAAAQRGNTRLTEFLRAEPAAESGEMWARIEGRLAQAARPRFRRWSFMAAAAVLALVAVFAWQLWQDRPRASLVSAMEADHREFLAGEFGPAFTGPAPGHVLAAAGGRVDAGAFAALPAGDGFTIEGSRLCHLAGVPVAWTLLKYEGRPVSWVALRREELSHFPDVREALEAGRPVVVKRVGEYQFTARRVGSHVVCALGDVPAETLTALLLSVPQA